MVIDDVTERFALMADLSAPSALRFKPLCEDAAAEIDRIVRVGVSAPEGVLCAAAASLALYRWAMMTASAGMGSFSAGDVKVTKSNSSVEMARQAWRESVAAAAPFLKDDGFLFERVCL